MRAGNFQGAEEVRRRCADAANDRSQGNAEAGSAKVLQIAEPNADTATLEGSNDRASHREEGYIPRHEIQGFSGAVRGSEGVCDLTSGSGLFWPPEADPNKRYAKGSDAMAASLDHDGDIDFDPRGYEDRGCREEPSRRIEKSREEYLFCPICNRHWTDITNHELNLHVDSCLQNEIIVLD